MARKARTDSPLNNALTIATLDRVLSEMNGTGDCGTFVTRKTDGTKSRHFGAVVERMVTGRGIRFRIEHESGFAIVDPAYLIVAESTFTAY